MKITGAAPKIAVPTFLYIIVAAIIDYETKPAFQITEESYSTLLAIGIIMIIAGVIIVANIGKKLRKAFKSGLLMMDGLYRYFRNPMYAAYLLLIIPGIGLILNSWLVLSSVIINFVLFQVFIKDEYNYLHDKFGKDYQVYLQKVWIKFL
ncbi:MAG: hypothetical protein FIA82_06620 [Melioribacter sp.]|nr:hypothetical protein [Melioribacter sp.]